MDDVKQDQAAQMEQQMQMQQMKNLPQMMSAPVFDPSKNPDVLQPPQPPTEPTA